jgi:hypothetical protein
MSLTPSELAKLAVTFPEEHVDQINAKSAKYGERKKMLAKE